MDTVLERATIDTTAEREAQLQHNAMIAERYRRLQNAEAYQFGEHTEETHNQANYTVRASVLAPEAPVMSAPTIEAPAKEQIPVITEFVRTPIDNPVFTTEKFNAVDSASEVAVAKAPVEVAAQMPVAIYAPASAISTEAQYSLSRAAKTVMAAFAAIVMLMITLICVNTQIIQRKSIELNNLEVQRDALIEENQEIQRRITQARSEETIRQFVESRGMN